MLLARCADRPRDFLETALDERAGNVVELEYEVNILTLSYTLFNTRGTETKTVGLKRINTRRQLTSKTTSGLLARFLSYMMHKLT